MRRLFDRRFASQYASYPMVTYVPLHLSPQRKSVSDTFAQDCDVKDAILFQMDEVVANVSSRRPKKRRWMILLVCITALSCYAIREGWISMTRSAMSSSAIMSLPHFPDARNKSDIPVKTDWQDKLNREYWNNHENVKRITAYNLAARKECLKSETCKYNQDKIILINEEGYIRSVMSPYYISGEQIWSRSVDIALQELGFTLAYYHEDLSQLSKIVRKHYGSWADISMVLTGARDIMSCARDVDCIYSGSGNPNGVPVWKTLALHCWENEKHPLGGKWVLSPEEYGGNTQYLGYSVEQQCRNVPFIEPRYRYGSKTKSNFLSRSRWPFTAGIRHHKRSSPNKSLTPGLSRRTGKSLKDADMVLKRKDDLARANVGIDETRRVAYVLAKRLSYFKQHVANDGKVSGAAFGQKQFDAAYERLNIRFEIGSTNDTNPSTDKVGYTNDPAKFENHDKLSPDIFPRVLSTVSVLIGLGDPPVGVPFINPILKWDAENPLDKSKWKTQHIGLISKDRPYVYHVFRDDTEGFVEAVKSAIDNPIERFLFPRMSQKQVNKRLHAILNKDYKGMANQLMLNRSVSGKEVFDID